MPTNQISYCGKKSISTVVKINFPGLVARQTSFTANANQSNESVTVVKMNFHRGKIQFPRW